MIEKKYKWLQITCYDLVLLAIHFLENQRTPHLRRFHYQTKQIGNQCHLLKTCKTECS